MGQGEAITYLGARILPARNGWRAYVSRPRGQGRARYQNRDLETVKAWIRTNIGALTASEPVLGPAEAAEYKAAAAALPPGITLLDAARRAQALAPAIDGDLPVSQAAREYLALLRDSGRRKRTLESSAWALKKLAGLAGRPVASILPSEIISICRLEKSPVTVDNIRRQLSGFFSWCLRAGYATRNPCDAIPRLRRDPPPPAIYTPAQVNRIFHAAEKHFPKAIPYLALSFFSGLRSSAISELQTEAIDWKTGQILVGRPLDKLRRSYYTDLTPACRRWLTAYPPGQRILPSSYWHFIRQVSVKIYAKARIRPIPNGARHSFATYLLASEPPGGAPWVALQLGHFGNTTTLVQNYRNLATRAAAKAYFSIQPGRNLAAKSRKL